MIKAKKIFFLSVIVVASLIASQGFNEGKKAELFLDQSAPYIGAGYPKEAGFSGEGIKIAVIDTGVDYNHPDLLGFGQEGKVIGGYDFVDNDKSPLDTIPAPPSWQKGHRSPSARPRLYADSME